MAHDRSSEFLAATLSALKKNGDKAMNTPPPLNLESDFHKFAKDLSSQIHLTSKKLQKLSKLSKERSLFADNSNEINRLTYDVKEDLQSLNDGLEKIQSLITNKTKLSKSRNQENTHENNVIGQLQSRMMDATQTFKTILQDRTEVLKDDQKRRGNFGLDKPSALGKPLVYKPSNSLPRPHQGIGYDNNNNNNIYKPSENSEESVPFISPLGLRSSSQLVANTTYLSERTTEVTNIQSHIVELGQIFNKLGSMVHEQEEMVTRLDENVDDAAKNVESGQQQLQRHLENLSSNKILVAKAFGIMVFFTLFYIVVS